jgi:molybdopterin converting factor small subunit
MQLTVKLFAMFRNDRFKVAQQDRPEGTLCRDIVLDLNLTEEEIGIILVNGRHAGLDHELKNGDTLSLFPLVGGG